MRDHFEPSRRLTLQHFLCTLVSASARVRFDRDDLPANWFLTLPDAMRVVQVTEPVVATSGAFRFAGDYAGLEPFSDTGTAIGWSNDVPVVTPYPDCVLVMPSLRQLRTGVTVIRLGRFVGESGAPG